MKHSTNQRLWQYTSRHKALFVFSLSLVAISTAAGLALPLVLGKIVDEVLLTKKSNLLFLAALIYLSIDFTRAIAFYLQSYFFTLLGQKVLQHLRRDLLTRYQFYPMREFIVTPTGRLVTRLINDTSSLQDIFTGGLAIAFGEVILVCATLVWLVILNPKMGLVSVSVFPIMVLIAKIFGKKIRIQFRRSRMALAKLNAFLAENIYGISCIQAFNKQEHFKEIFRKKSGIFTKMQLGAVKNYAFFHPSITVLSSFSMGLLIWYGGFLSLSETPEVSLGLLVAFVTYLQSLYTPIRDIIEKYNLFVSAMTSTERVFDFLDRPCESQILMHKPSSSLEAVKGVAIEFNNIYFRYQPNSSWTLKGISFQIEPGKKFGIVGHTGAGKSTLITLLMRFYDTNVGEIKVAGKNILDYTKQELRAQIGYIQQEPFLFSQSIRDNILLWNEENEKNIRDVLPLFPEIDLSKMVLERGSNLSAGERQIISFLRAVACAPQVFILDEATSHIDSLTEARIEQASDIAFRNKTVLIIAHRLSTLKRVDKLLMFERGEIVEQGTHDELLSLDGKYKKMYEESKGVTPSECIPALSSSAAS